MAYRDQWITCTRCGEQFVFRVEEQRRQERQEGQIVPPELCATCRRLVRSRKPERKPRPTEALGYGPHEGSVKWYSEDKGYGFIVHSSGQEIFFHHTGIAPGEKHEFPEGTRVTFLVEETERGPQAVEVERMDV